MTAELAGQAWMMVGVYAGVGVIVALLFVTVLIKRASVGAQTSAPLQFRILIFPACVALWPIVLIRGLIGGAKGEAMRRPLRRLHFMMWLILTPFFLALIAYALTRTPIDRIDADAPPALFEAEGGR